MKTLICILFSVLFFGCGTFQQHESVITPPELLESDQLPTVPAEVYIPTLELKAEMLISTTGIVESIKLLNSSGNKSWDSLAVKSIKKWLYTPALLDDKPIAAIVRQKIKVKFADPVYMGLAVIICSNAADADSAYSALANGEDFNSVVKRYSVGDSKNLNGMLGKVDIHRYPDEIQQILLKMDENEFSKPLKYGTKFIIFKKLNGQKVI